MILISIQKWLDRFLNQMPSPQHEPLVDRRGVVYWLKIRVNEEAGTMYLDIVYRREGTGCGGDSNVVKLMWESLDRLRINDICLAPQYRRAGLGSELLRRVILLAEQKGIRSIHGDIGQDDLKRWPGLLGWYQHHGFRVEPPTGTSYAHSIVLDLI